MVEKYYQQNEQNKPTGKKHTHPIPPVSSSAQLHKDLQCVLVKCFGVRAQNSTIVSVHAEV